MDQVIHPQYKLTVDARFVIPNFGEEEFAKALVRQVCTYSKLPLHALEGVSRRREVVRARQLAFLAMYRYTDLTLKFIGEQLGDRDHTTVIHSVGTICDMFDIQDPITVNFVAPFIRELDTMHQVKRRKGTGSNHNI